MTERKMQLLYGNGYERKIRVAEIEDFIKNVLTELNSIAEDDDYYFDKDNANLVSTVLYGQFEKLKEQSATNEDC